MAALKMYVLKNDKESGMKLGICCTEYYIFEYNDWNKVNTDDFAEAERIFEKMCREHVIEEMKRTGTVLAG